MAGKEIVKETNYFHRSIDLQYGCGCDTLRQLMDKKLKQFQITLQDHLTKNNKVKQAINKLHPKFINKEQYMLLYPTPYPQNFDISLLSKVLLHGSFQLTAVEIKNIENLRTIRNHLSHVPSPELQDDTKFNEACNSILTLAKACGKEFEKKTKNCITSLRKMELVRVVSKAELVKLRNESYMVALVESGDDAINGQSDTTLLRYNITKWKERLIEAVQLDVLLSDLKKDGVITFTEKANIEKYHNKTEQCSALILKVTDETNENILKFCSCLRKHNPHLADLIENKADDGSDIATQLESQRHEAIRKTLHDIVKPVENSKTATEDLHIAVEERLGYIINFPMIEAIVEEDFNKKPSGGAEARYDGLELKSVADISGTFETSTSSSSTKDEDEADTEFDISWNDSCEDLAEKIGILMEKRKGGYGILMKAAILNECLSPKNFSRLTESKLNTCFEEHLKGKRLPLGLLEDLIEFQAKIQEQLRTQNNPSIVREKRKPLREFDSPSGSTEYEFGAIVKPEKGNILVPVHEFKSMEKIDFVPKSFVVRECVRFIAACLNSRQNGTIHFGIESIGEGTGKITGFRLDMVDVDELDLSLESGIEFCFDKTVLHVVKSCIRPIQVVKINETSGVVELDVVPSSWYTGESYFRSHFPPKGKQTENMFVFTIDINPEIISTPLNRYQETEKIYLDRVKDRNILESRLRDISNDDDESSVLLKERITAGSKYITDHFTPIIVTGKMSGIENEDTVRDIFEESMADVFRSAAVVLDFDDNTRTLKLTEQSSTFFKIFTTDDTFSFHDNPPTDPCWIYCNGNKDLSISELSTNKWIQKRMSFVQEILSDLKRMLPRALVIFLIYEPCLSDSPIVSIANECMISTFRNKCILIAESEDIVSGLKTNVLKRETEDENFEVHFHTALLWKDVTKLLRSVTKPSTFDDIQLPCRNGKITFLSRQKLEKMGITDIEIVSGKQCLDVEEMEIEKQRTVKKTAKENFYRGDEVSWHNFHFGDHVCSRDIYQKLMHSVRRRLKRGDDLIETETILHQPGAGGTTTGKNLLWALSQFNTNGMDRAYRCCIIRKITESTADQICKFMFYDETAPKTAVVLVDNATEDNVAQLNASLEEKAYKRHNADVNVFCLVIVIRRVPVTYMSKPVENVLVHQLTNTEQTWFEDKYKELEGTDDIDMETLISFNVMRKSFDPKYIDDLVGHLLRGVKNTEIPLLKCLSLINVFDRDSPIPSSVFDHILFGEQRKSGSINFGDLINRGPIGLVVPMQSRHNQETSKYPWNAHNTDAFRLMTRSCTSYSDTSGQEFTGVMMVSQALAESVLKALLAIENISLEQVVKFVLEITKTHVSERSAISREFVRIVTSLFKTRQATEDGDSRAKFSEMIMHFLKLENTSTDEINRTIISFMGECFEITNDAMVGQQLARFYIYLKEYTSAEQTILKSIKIQPDSSYLRDTHGQVFFSKIEHKLPVDRSCKVSIDETAEIISTAFSAIDIFREGQKITSEKEYGDNTSCYYMEVKTVLLLLEHFSKFCVFQNEEEFLDILNDPEKDVPLGYKALFDRCEFSRLIRNRPYQIHADDSLRFLEEKDYQLKRRWYTIQTEKDEQLLLKLRERFERFYGNEAGFRSHKFKYGVGLKSLMNANVKDESVFRKAVDDAQLKLQVSGFNLQYVDKRDLLLLLGHEVIKMSSRRNLTSFEEQPMAIAEYQTLLRYSEKLHSIEAKSQRPYLEAYLYYTIFSWPSEARKDIQQLGGPEKLKNILVEWDEKFHQNFRSQLRRKSLHSKTFFGLGNGLLGKDIVDFRSVEQKWRETTGKKRGYVQNDQMWNKAYARKVLKRLTGTLNGTGTSISYETKHRHWNYEFNIGCLYKVEQRLSNRLVTFVLLFTWSGLKAGDIKSIDDDLSVEDDGPSSLETKDEQDENSDSQPKSNGKGATKRSSYRGSSRKKKSTPRRK